MIFNKKLGVTLIESIISLSLISTGVISGTVFYLDKQASEQLDFEAKRINYIISGFDSRFHLDGYSNLLWKQEKTANTNDKVKKILENSLISTYNRECGLASGWNPQQEDEKEQSLMPCDYTDLSKSNFNYTFKLESDPNNFIERIELLISTKESVVEIEKFNKNLENLINVRNRLPKEEQITYSGLKDFYFAKEADPEKRITLNECTKAKENCVIVASWDRAGETEELRRDGKNSIINDHISFRTDSFSDPLLCDFWNYNEVTKNYDLIESEKCGLGIYEQDIDTPFIKALGENLNTEGVFLNASCNSYKSNAAGYLIADGVVPCGIYEDKNNLKIMTISSNLDAESASVSDLVSKEVTSETMNNALLKVNGETFFTTLNVELTTVFKDTVEFKDLIVEKNIIINEANLNTLTVTAENTFSNPTFEDNVLIEKDLEVTDQVSAPYLLSTTDALAGESCNTSLENNMAIQKDEGILIICKHNPRTNGLTWQSNSLGEISPFDGECPIGWRELTEAEGRFIVGSGTIDSIVLDTSIRDQNGDLDFSRMAKIKEVYKEGDIGGKSSIQLTEDQIPNHDHSTVNTDHAILGQESAREKLGGVEFKANSKILESDKNNAPSQGDLSTDSVGLNKAHENRPSYYAVTWCVSEESLENKEVSTVEVSSEWVDYPDFINEWYNVGSLYDCTIEVEENLLNPSKGDGIKELVKMNNCKQDQKRDITKREIKYNIDGTLNGPRNKLDSNGQEIIETETRTILVQRAWVLHTPSYTDWVDYDLPFNCANDGVIVYINNTPHYRRTCDQIEERYRQEREIEIGTEEIRDLGDPIRETKVVRKHVFQSVTPTYVDCTNWIHHSYTSNWVPNLNNYYARDSIRQTKSEIKKRTCSYYGTISTGEEIVYKVEEERKTVTAERYMPGNIIVLYVNDVTVKDAAYKTDAYMNFAVYSDATIPNNGVAYSFGISTSQSNAKEFDSTQNSSVGAAGVVRISTDWSSGDIDTWVRDPCGSWIGYYNRSSNCRGKVGVLDVDDTSGRGPGENVTWPNGATAGNYYMCLHSYSGSSYVAWTKAWIGQNKIERYGFNVTRGRQYSCKYGTYVHSGYYDPYAKYEVYDYEKYNTRKSFPKNSTTVNNSIKLYGGHPTEGTERFYVNITNPSPSNLVEIRDSTGVVTIVK